MSTIASNGGETTDPCYLQSQWQELKGLKSASELTEEFFGGVGNV
jgi:hypothetical protein